MFYFYHIYYTNGSWIEFVSESNTRLTMADIIVISEENELDYKTLRAYTIK